jgi:hypothetical protein
VTPEELGQTLKMIDHNEHLAFLHKFAEKRDIPEDFVEYFVYHPEDERLLAHLLGLQTEEEKNTSAAISSAHSAKMSAIWAAVCTIITIAALAFTVFQSCNNRQTRRAHQSVGGESGEAVHALTGAHHR